MFRDDSMDPIPPSGLRSASPIPTLAPVDSNFDALDDIFGSAPPSPVLGSNSIARQNASGDTTSTTARPRFVDPSDIPRLRSEHSTAGYRDGTAAAKAASVQSGFDEGYSLAAVIGVRCGVILGVLEGLWRALASDLARCNRLGAEGSWMITKDFDERVSVLKSGEQHIRTYLTDAKKELATESIFGPQFWGSDGIWTFEVSGEENGSVLFGDVATAHPLLKKWETFITSEAEDWTTNPNILEDTGEDWKILTCRAVSERGMED
jgi:hypothetical protein